MVAQSPGGVSIGLELWLKADDGFTYNSATNAEWLDQSPNAIVFNANLVQGPDADSAPTLGEGTLNFNPSLIFDGIDTGLATAVDGADFGFSEWSFFSVQKAPQNDNGGTIAQYGNNGSNNFSFYLLKDVNKPFVITVNSIDIFGTSVFDDLNTHILGYTNTSSGGIIYYDAQLSESWLKKEA